LAIKSIDEHQPFELVVVTKPHFPRASSAAHSHRCVLVFTKPSDQFFEPEDVIVGNGGAETIGGSARHEIANVDSNAQIVNVDRRKVCET
jgi:hypothetical protein